MRRRLDFLFLFLIFGGSTVASQAQSLQLDPPAVTGGGTAEGTVTLSMPAPVPGGKTVKLSSDNSAVAKVPQTVTVGPGLTKSGPFTITTVAVTASTSVSISASADGESAIPPAKLQVNPAVQSSWASLYTRAVAGIDVSAGSSLPAQQHLFLEFNLTTPMPFGKRNSASNRRAEAKRCVDALNSISGTANVPSVSLNTALTDSQKTAITAAMTPTKCGAYQAEFASDSEVYSNLQNLSGPAGVAPSTLGQFESDAKVVRRNYDLDYSPLAQHFWFWLNPRISAVPSQASNLLSTVTTSNSTVNSQLTQQYNQVVQDFELTAGIEAAPFGPHRWARLGDNALLGFSFIAGAGLTTPLSATQSNTQIFSLPAAPSASLVTQLGNNGVTTTTTMNGTATSTICGTSGSPNLPNCTNAIAFFHRTEHTFSIKNLPEFD